MTPPQAPNPKTSTTAPQDKPQRILVWDAPVRVFHWLTVASFAGAWLTAESERWRLAHLSLGYTLAGLVVFRLLWGVMGTRHARFASFVRGPQAALAYLRSLFKGQPHAHVGHNPAAGLAIVMLLGLAVVVTASGLMHYHGLGGDGFEALHEGAAIAMLALVGLHVAGVVAGSLAHRENLVRAMITGTKRGDAHEAAGRAWRPLGALLVAAVVGFLWLQWQAPVVGVDAKGQPPATAHAGHEHGKHDGHRARPGHDDDD